VSAPAAEGLRLPTLTAPTPPPDLRHAPPRSVRRLWLLALAVAVAWSAYGCGLGRLPLVNSAGWPVASDFLAAALHPDLDTEFLRLVGTAALVTVAYAVLGTALTLAIGALGCVVVSDTFWRAHGRGRARSRGATAAWAGLRGGLALPRGLHEAVWGILLVNLLGLDPLVAILAIAIPYGAITVKVWADLLDEVPHEPYDALRQAGAGRLTATLYGLVPQAGTDLLSYSFYRLECALRSAVLLGIVGAGGLGFELDLSFQALRYPEMWTVLYAVVLLCVLTDAASTRVRRQVFVARPAARRTTRGRPRRNPVLAGAGLGAVALVLWSWVYLDVRPSTLWSARVSEQVSLVVGDALPPSADVGELVRLSIETLQMSVLAITLAAAGGALLALAAARVFGVGVSGVGVSGARVSGAGLSGAARARRRPGRQLLGVGVRLVLLLLRAVPPPVWALVLLFVTYPGPMPGALALAAYNLGILGRLMAEGVENLDPAPTAALTDAGARAGGAWLYGTLPRIAPRFLVFGLYRWEVAVRETVVVGIVGAGGLGDLLMKQISAFDWAGVSGTLIALVLLTLLVDLISAAARSALR
jgi:phosphonate transport system permease protein